jgi:hypothetical protein
MAREPAGAGREAGRQDTMIPKLPESSHGLADAGYMLLQLSRSYFWTGRDQAS